MFCGECGTENPETNKFCKNCGKPLRKNIPAVQPAPATSLPATAISPVPGPAPVPETPVLPRKFSRNWIGFASLICGILSWVILTVLLAMIAVVLGGLSLYKTRKETGKIAISAVAAIVIAIAAVAAARFLG